jgi:hypothetical protein
MTALRLLLHHVLGLDPDDCEFSPTDREAAPVVATREALAPRRLRIGGVALGPEESPVKAEALRSDRGMGRAPGVEGR